MEKWKCKNCNFVLASDEPPRICPNCGHKTEFRLVVEHMPPFNELYDE